MADEVFREIKGLYHGLEQYGRAGVARRVRAPRAARRGSGTATA